MALNMLLECISLHDYFVFLCDVQAVRSTSLVCWIHHTRWVDHGLTTPPSATIDCESGLVSVYTGMMSLTSGQLLAATCMSHPRLILPNAGTQLPVVFVLCHCFVRCWRCRACVNSLSWCIQKRWGRWLIVPGWFLPTPVVHRDSLLYMTQPSLEWLEEKAG